MYGENIPVIHSAVITGRAEFDRSVHSHSPGTIPLYASRRPGYRHYIEATLFGLPFMQVDEATWMGNGSWQDAVRVDQGPQVDQGANLGLWAESMWLPAIFLTTRALHWEPVDDVTALPVVPSTPARNASSCASTRKWMDQLAGIGCASTTSPAHPKFCG